jgi:hypothetical protein
MTGLFYMITFYVGDDPQVARVLTQWVARVFPGIRSFEVFLAGIFLWNANGVQVEDIIVSLGEPDDSLVSARKPLRAMQSMLEVPDDTVSHLQPKFHENRVKHCIERNNCPIVNVVPNLPANAPARSKTPDTLSNYLSLLFEVKIEM